MSDRPPSDYLPFPGEHGVYPEHDPVSPPLLSLDPAFLRQPLLEYNISNDISIPPPPPPPPRVAVGKVRAGSKPRSCKYLLGQSLIIRLRREYPLTFKWLEQIHRSDSSTEDKSQELQQLLRELCKTLEERELWQPSLGFLRHDISDPDIFRSPTPAVLGELLFLLIANQVFLMRGESPVCVICGRLKEHGKTNPTEGDPGCHIFAECWLRAYKIIHGLPDASFIWDCIREEQVNIGLRKPPVAYKLACQECEMKGAQSELPLRNLYSFICRNKHNRIDVRHSEVWGYVYIVATVLLRGFLVNIDILEQIYSSKDCEGLLRSCFQLVGYIRSNTQPLPEIHQFLAPQEPDSASHLLNSQLRGLHYTHMVNEKGGLFLLSHFDIFYWVMPLNETGIDMLKSENGIPLEPDESIILACTSDRTVPHFLRRHIRTLAFELEAYRSEFPPDYHMDSIRMFVQHPRVRLPQVFIDKSCKAKQKSFFTAIDLIPFTRDLAYARNWSEVEPERELGLLQPGEVSRDELQERCTVLKGMARGLQSEIQKTRLSTKKQIKATMKQVEKEIKKIQNSMREFKARFRALEEQVCTLQIELEERLSKLDERISIAEKHVAELKKFSIIAWSKQNASKT